MICGHWLEVELALPITNAKGIGSRITVVSGNREWTEWIVSGNSHVSSGPPRVHFGLGDISHIDAVIVVEPDGTEWSHDDVSMDQRITLSRP